jgi:hypothetical protein
LLGLLDLEVVVCAVGDSATDQNDSVEADAEAAGRRRGGCGGSCGVSGLGLGVTGLERDRVSVRTK